MRFPMKISAKGRYALAAMTYIAQNHLAEMPITIVNLADKLGISKIYLEQIFSLLKRANLVTSIKGAHGGYQLSSSPNKINAYQILTATDFSLFEQTENTVIDKSPAIEQALRSCIFDSIEQTLQANLENITLADIAAETTKYSAENELMYFI